MQVLPTRPQSSVHTQPSAPHEQLDGWQVLGSGSGVHTKSAGQPVSVQLTGLGTPLHTGAVASATQLAPSVPQSAVHTQPSAAQEQLEEWQVFGSASVTQV